MIRGFVCNPFMEMTYVVSDENRNAVIIDCGCSTVREQQKLVSYIENNNLHPIALLNTHFHLDHQFGNHFILEKYGLKPYGSPLDEPLMKSQSAQYAAFNIYNDVLDGIIEPTDQTDYLPIYDGETLTFGDMHFQVIATPGHTPGSVCFLLDKACLFSGDTLFAGGMGRTDLPYGDYDTLMQSLQRLAVLSGEITIYPGHGPNSTIKRELGFYRTA